jgi:hypothetical protein
MLSLPALPYDEWRDTRETLHRWMQVVGKIRLGLTPVINHWWNVTLYVSTRGLTTSAIPIGDRVVELELDFVDDVLRVRSDDKPDQLVELRPRTVADFYAATVRALRAAEIECRIYTMPVELTNPIPFEEDHEHRSYDKEYVLRFWHNVSRIAGVLTKFRSGFIGKCSPVQFFWGSFDLAVTRFSGRRAPPIEGDAIEREAYSHEVCSAGWWPGDPRLERASFYCYASPEPPGFPQARISPPQAYYSPFLKGFYLDHDQVRRAADPEAVLLEFCESTYAAAADLGAWPRADLERARSATRAEDNYGELYASRDTRQQPSSDERLRGVPATGR